MHHPSLGEIVEARSGGWGLTLSLPAFQPFYERWDGYGGERLDTRDDDEKAGRFRIRLLPVLVDGPGLHGPQPPSKAQVAAVAYLQANQHRIAEAVRTALVKQGPEVFPWDHIEAGVSEETRASLASPEWMMQVVELQSVVVGFVDHEGLARVGFAFHSEILEPEHGVSVVLHRDQPIQVGTWDDLMALEPRDEDDRG